MNGKAGKYDVYLSTVTLREIEKCSEPKKTQLIDSLSYRKYKFKGNIKGNLIIHKASFFTAEDGT